MRMEQRPVPLVPVRSDRYARDNQALRTLEVVRNPGVASRSLSRDMRLVNRRLASPGGDLPTVSLLFAPGTRSGADRVLALAASDRSFLVSSDPRQDEEWTFPSPANQWLEVLANGLTFDLDGLAPGAPQPMPPAKYRYGLPSDLETDALEAVSLRPGPSLAAGARMLPVVRSLAWLAASLAHLPGVRAVAWHAARTISTPDHFRGSVLRWVEGGAFPGLGLAALSPTIDGGLQSEGLALFTGQELRLVPDTADDLAAGARLAFRLLHWLVVHGTLEAPTMLPGPSGEMLWLEPSNDQTFVEVSLG